MAPSLTSAEARAIWAYLEHLVDELAMAGRITGAHRTALLAKLAIDRRGAGEAGARLARAEARLRGGLDDLDAGAVDSARDRIGQALAELAGGTPAALPDVPDANE